MNALVALALTENVRVLLKRRADELVLLPQVGSEEAIGVADGGEGGLEGVLEGLGAAGRSGVDVVYTSKLEQTLDGGRSDQTGTTGRRDQLSGVSRGAFCGYGEMIRLTRTVTEPHLPLSLTGIE